MVRSSGTVKCKPTFVFYVLLTPLWIGLRGAAWVAEFRRRGGAPVPETPSTSARSTLQPNAR